MASIVVISKVKDMARKRGKRVGRSFIDYLNRRVVEIVEANMHILGSRRTLTAEDANALESLSAR